MLGITWPKSPTCSICTPGRVGLKTEKLNTIILFDLENGAYISSYLLSMIELDILGSFLTLHGKERVLKL